MPMFPECGLAIESGEKLPRAVSSVLSCLLGRGGDGLANTVPREMPTILSYTCETTLHYKTRGGGEI
jgi:hypothetical protein